MMGSGTPVVVQKSYLYVDSLTERLTCHRCSTGVTGSQTLGTTSPTKTGNSEEAVNGK